MRAAIVAIAMTLAIPAMAQVFETPEALIEAFYQPYFGGEFHEDDAPFRSVALNALYDQDAQLTPDGEMGAISFDPYIDGQDFDITAFEIGAVEVAGESATAEVSFENFGEPRTLVYELVYEDGWKIDDVVSTTPNNQYRLSEIFVEAAGL
jgi:hypothetical protein